LDIIFISKPPHKRKRSQLMFKTLSNMALLFVYISIGHPLFSPTKIFTLWSFFSWITEIGSGLSLMYLTVFKCLMMLSQCAFSVTRFSKYPLKGFQPSDMQKTTL